VSTADDSETARRDEAARRGDGAATGGTTVTKREFFSDGPSLLSELAVGAIAAAGKAGRGKRPLPGGAKASLHPVSATSSSPPDGRPPTAVRKRPPGRSASEAPRPEGVRAFLRRAARPSSRGPGGAHATPWDKSAGGVGLPVRQRGNMARTQEFTWRRLWANGPACCKKARRKENPGPCPTASSTEAPGPVGYPPPRRTPNGKPGVIHPFYPFVGCAQGGRDHRDRLRRPEKKRQGPAGGASSRGRAGFLDMGRQKGPVGGGGYHAGPAN